MSKKIIYMISKNIIWIKNNIFSSKIILRYQHIKSTWLICQIYNPVHKTMITSFKVNKNKLRFLIFNQSNIEVLKKQLKINNLNQFGLTCQINATW